LPQIIAFSHPVNPRSERLRGFFPGLQIGTISPGFPLLRRWPFCPDGWFVDRVEQPDPKNTSNGLGMVFGASKWG